jgi:hypothetical protein
VNALRRTRTEIANGIENNENESVEYATRNELENEQISGHTAGKM